MIYLFALYMALPAFIANMAPVFAAKFDIAKVFNHPIDRMLFGEHKTWRGFVTGVFAALITTLVQWCLYAPHLTDMTNAAVFGVLAGVGALSGDLAKSYFKRQLHIAPGKPFIPFDWIDYMIGFLLCTYPLYSWSMQESIFLLAAVIILNPLTNMLGYLTGIKSTYW